MAALTARSAAGKPLAAGAHDIRGWEVRTLVDDRFAGSVHDLLLDEDGLVRWLDLAPAEGRHVLVPAGQARAEPSTKLVRLPGMAGDQLALLPAYDVDSGGLDATGEAQRLAAYAAALLRERQLPGGPAPQAAAVPLADLPDFKVASGEPDPRGWPLVGAAGERLGRIEELLVDPRLLRARHLVCTIGDEERRVRVPIGQVQVDADARLVLAYRLTPESVRALPAWPDAGAPSGTTFAGDLASVQDDSRLDPRALFGEEGS